MFLVEHLPKESSESAGEPLGISFVLQRRSILLDLTFNNYSVKVDIYWAVKQLDRYPPLATGTEVNSSVSIIILNQLDNIGQKSYFNSFIPATITIFSAANPARVSERE